MSFFSGSTIIDMDLLSKKCTEYIDKSVESNDIVQFTFSEDEKALIDQTFESVQKAKSILLENLDKHSELLKNENFILEQKKQMMSIFEDMRSQSINVLHISKQLDDTNEVNDEIQNNCDGVTYSVDCLESLMGKLITEKHNNIQNKIKVVKDKLEYMSKLYGMTRGLAGKNTCPICMSGEIDVAFDPCGHCVCSKCVKWSSCYICRKKITKNLRLYFL